MIRKASVSKRIFGSFICVWSTASIANDDTRTEGANDKAVEQTSVVATSGPVDREGSGFGGGEDFNPPVLEFSSEESQVLATLSLGYTWANSGVEDQEDGAQRVTADIIRFGLKGSLPFSGSDQSDNLDFRNIGNDAEIGMSLTWFGSGYNTSHQHDVNVARSYRACFKTAIDQKLVGASQQEGEILTEQFAQFNDALDGIIRERDAGNDSYEVRGLVEYSLISGEPSAPMFPKVQAEISGLCFASFDEEYIFQRYGAAALGAEGFRNAREERYDDSALYFAGGEANFGYETYNVLDRTLFQINEESKVGIDGRLYAGIISGDGKFSGRLAGGYARGFEAQNEAEFCIPVPNSLEETCISGEDGKPTRNDTAYASLEGRFVLSSDSSGRPRFAIAPEVTYQFNESDFLIDVPLYFSRTDNAGLSGGIRAAYDTGKDDLSIRLFLGVPFSIWF